MRINDVISEINQLNQGILGDEKIVRLLSDLDEQIFNEIIKTHEGAQSESFIRYDSPEYTGDGELLLPGIYAGIYKSYCNAAIYETNGEGDRYNAAVSAFNTLYGEYAAYYNRTHLPISKSKITF